MRYNPSANLTEIRPSFNLLFENYPKSKRDEELGWQLKPGPVRVRFSYNRLAVDQTLHMLDTFQISDTDCSYKHCCWL